VNIKKADCHILPTSMPLGWITLQYQLISIQGPKTLTLHASSIHGAGMTTPKVTNHSGYA